MSSKSLVHVAVGVIVNAAREVLVARRHESAHQGGLLEFPGGKYEPGEDRFVGLQREFREELGVAVNAAFPIKQITHHYPDKSVILDVWVITDYSGVPAGLEGQPIQWLPVAEMQAEHFPAANKPIIDVLQLPTRLAITPDCHDWDELRPILEGYLQQGISLVQLRQKSIPQEEYSIWYRKARALCGDAARVMFSHSDAVPDVTAVDGIHCNAKQLASLAERPCAEGKLFAASCHNLDELRQAEKLGADYVTLSPVCKTDKYSQQQLLGWVGFSELRRKISLPVFALGGMSEDTFSSAMQAGAQGIAGIRLFLCNN